MCPKEFMLTKPDILRGCIVSHYRYFLDNNFRFHPKVCSCCHDLMQKAMSLNFVAIVAVKAS